jgi:hypothetical protein
VDSFSVSFWGGHLSFEAFIFPRGVFVLLIMSILHGRERDGHQILVNQDEVEAGKGGKSLRRGSVLLPDLVSPVLVLLLPAGADSR